MRDEEYNVAAGCICSSHTLHEVIRRQLLLRITIDDDPSPQAD